MTRTTGINPNDPTPEEIREECERIREGWQTKRITRQENRQSWQPPVLRETDLAVRELPPR